MSPVDLSVDYLGLRLAHPLMPGASPLVDDLDTVRRLEDAGAAAIVMHSLFEEQVARDPRATFRRIDAYGADGPDAASYFPSSDVYALGPVAYLERLGKIRAAVDVPVIASLNGTTPGGWCEYAALMQEAGAHAIELNLYALPTDPTEDGAAVEARMVDVVREVRRVVHVPLAIKLSPYVSSMPAFVRRLEAVGASGFVLFNRLYQPDLDPEALAVKRSLHLSEPSELAARLHFLAIVFGATRCSLAATGGVHSGRDAVKAVMAGARGVQVVSALLKHGVGHLRVMLDEMTAWFEQHAYERLATAVGSLSLAHCPDSSAYERANYVQLLQSLRG
jgi:dihydroorotate dehydrogenase (fumarate)